MLRNAFFWKLDPYPPPCIANNIEPYTLVTFFSGKFDTPHPRYVTLEWPLIPRKPVHFKTHNTSHNLMLCTGTVVYTLPMRTSYTVEISSTFHIVGFCPLFLLWDFLLNYPMGISAMLTCPSHSESCRNVPL